MNKIDPIVVQEQLNQFVNQPVFIHLETTNGAYAAHHNRAAYNVGAFIRNAKVCFTQAKISGDPTNYRVGLKTEIGWVYAEGLRDYQLDQPGCLLLAGHDDQGRLLVTLEISHQPFSI